MLKKTLRLTRKELGLFYKKKSFFEKGEIITLKFIENKHGFSKFAFIVSGPPKSAAQRNLTRRRVSEIVRTEIKNFPKSLSAVFYIKLDKNKKPPKFNNLKKDIKNVISFINI